MKKYLLSILMAALIITILALPALADALYRGTILVTNSGNSTIMNASVNFSLNSDVFIADGYASENFSDVSIQSNGAERAFMPGYNDGPWVVFVPTVAGGTSVDYSLYTKGATGGKLRYFPGTGGMAVSDNDSNLEPGEDFEIRYSGYVNTGDWGIIIYKPFAFLLETDNTGDITASIISSTPTEGTGKEKVPTSDGDVNGTWNAAPRWDDVDETTPNDADYITGTTDGGGYCLFNYIAFDMNDRYPGGLKVYYRAERVAAGVANIRAGIKVNGTVYYEPTGNVPGDSFETYSYTWTQNPATSAAWTIEDIEGTGSHPLQQFGVYSDDLLPDIRVSMIYAVPMVEDKIVQVISTESDGDYDIEVSADTSNLYLYIDDMDTPVDATALSGASVPDNSNDWQIGDPETTPYIQTANITVSSVLVGSWEWEYGATFTDLSGNGNDATPTFRTASSDAYLSASLIDFLPVDEARVDTFTIGVELPDLAPPGEFGEQMYIEGDYSHVPGAEAVNEMLGEGGVPYSLWWYPFLYLSICIIGFIIYGATQGPMPKSSTSNPYDGSLLTMSVVMEVAIVVIGIIGLVPLWPAYLFPIPAIALIISRKHYAWG